MVCCSNVEDQDSSSEGGLSSNWWVLGSQGKDPLSVSGDATLQTLPQFALSSLGTQNGQQQQRSTEGENTVENCEQSRCKNQEPSGDERRKGNGEKSSDVEASPTRRNQIEEGGEKREHNKHRENESASNDEGNYFYHFSIFHTTIVLHIENNAIHCNFPL